MKIFYLLRTRLIIVMALMFLLLVGLAASAMFSIQSVNDSLHETISIAHDLRPITQLQALILKAINPPHHYLIYGYPEEREEFSQLSQDINKAFADALAISASAEQKLLIASAQQEWQEVRSTSEAILLLSDPKTTTLNMREMDRLHNNIDLLVNLLDQSYELAYQKVQEHEQKAHDIVHRALFLTLLAFGFGLVVTIINIIILLRSILAPIRELEEGANKFGEGDISHRIPLNSKDELGNLAKAFNIMAERLGKSQQALEEFATHDGLTGLNNSREFHRLLQAEIERSQRYKRPLSLLIIDVDYFKNINDKYGHQFGDSVLREIATQMQRGVRSIDYVARYGGEEFTILLPDIPVSGAMNVAERLRNTIANHALILREGQTVNVTVSIGVATFPEDATSGKELVAAADRAMYAAKAAGRNKVCRQSEA